MDGDRLRGLCCKRAFHKVKLVTREGNVRLGKETRCVPTRSGTFWEAHQEKKRPGFLAEKSDP